MSYYDPDLKKQVLTQDAEQVAQSTQKARESRLKKEQAEYEKAVKEYERDTASAEAQYQKDLAEYNKQLANAEKEQNKYAAEKARLEAKKQEKLAAAHRSVWGEGGSRNRSELRTKEAAITKEYNILISKVSEQQRRETGYQEFRETYPGQVLPRNVAETFRASPSFSLVGLYQQKIEGKAAKAEYQRQASAQTAQAVSAKMSAEYHSDIPNIGFISSGLGTERGAAVKPLPDAPQGKKAVETRRPLINVKTHETIYGGIQIEANPRAFVASLDRQNVTAAGKRLDVITGKEGTQTVYSFGNISNVQDESAIALLEFQQQLKTRTAPSATVYKGILEERGLPLTPLSKKIIDTYSSKGIFRDYEEPVPAKGRKGIISKDGKQLFDLETGQGSIRIGHLLGYKYSKPQMVTELGKDIQGPPAPLWAVPDAFGQPRTDFSGNPILLKSEESAKKVSEKFADKPSEMTVPVIGGEQKLKVMQPKMSDLGKEIQRGYEQLEKESISLQKSQKSDNPLLAAYQYVAPVGIATGKSIYAGLAFGVNQAEQVQSPFYRKLLGLKPAQKVAPVTIGDASGVVILPVNFEKIDLRKPETYGQSFLNPFEKEYQQRQSEYIKKYGVTEYASGIVFDYGGLKGVPSLLKGTIKSTPKLITKISTPKKQLIGVKGGLLAESRPFSYDIPYKPTKRPNEIDFTDFGERVGPATPISKKPIAARQSDVILPKQKKIIPVKEDLTYKPATRANEIRVSGIIPKENVIGKIQFSKGFIPSKIEKPLKGKIPEPVKPDPLSRPTRRPNEIDLSRDTVLPTFETTRIKLGRGTIQPRRTQISGKKESPVKEDFFYKPSKRANEIDLSDFGEKIKMPKVEPEKSEIGLNLERELKRLKRKQPEFKAEKFSLGGEGIYLSGKRQSLILIKKQEQLTKKKLVTKRKTPLSINWSEQIETVKIPKAGKSPIQILVPREKKKKKSYLQEQTFAVQSYEVPLSTQRPKIKSVQRSEIRQEFKSSSPQRIQESLKIETVQPQKLSQRPKAITRQRSVAEYKVIPIIKIAPRQVLKTSPKLSSPLAPKAPTKLSAPQRQPLREKPVQVTLLRERPPRRPPRVVFALPPDKEPEKKKARKEAKSEIGFYIGNVPLEQISGVFKRKEITLGKEKIQRIRKGDVRVLGGKTRTTSRKKQQEDMLGFKKGKKATKFF